MTGGADIPQDADKRQAQQEAQQYNQVRDLATVLAAPASVSAVVVKGSVTAVDAIVFADVPHTVTVTLSGDTTAPISNVRFLDSYTPRVGDTVLIVKQGSELFVLGQMSLAQTVKNGWVEATLGSGFTQNSLDPVQYRVVYDNGSPKVQLRGGANISGTPTTVFTMPAGFRPLTNKTPITIARGSANDYTGSNVALLQVNSDGTMVLAGATMGVAAASGPQTGIGGGSAVTGSSSSSSTGFNGFQSSSTSGAQDNLDLTNGNTAAAHIHYDGQHTHPMSHTHVGGNHQHPLYNVAYPTSISFNGVEYFL